MSWNYHAYQYNKQYEADTEEQRLTEPLKDDMQPYRFEFEEFDGAEGKLALERILRTILPSALYRTWQTIIDIPTGKDPMPYVGTELIAKYAGCSLRRIEFDLQRLQQMNLLQMRQGMEPRDGKMVAVERKDFTNLYKFAREYLLWEQSPGFAMYPPDKRFADLIRENRELYQKLVRFKNYKSILENKKTGPKKQENKAIWENQSEQEAPQSRGEMINSLDSLRNSTKKIINSSPYESYNLDIDSLLDSNLTQDLNFIQEDLPLTRSEGECRYLHDDTTAALRSCPLFL